MGHWALLVVGKVEAESSNLSGGTRFLGYLSDT
jgi:hypothetical protein